MGGYINAMNRKQWLTLFWEHHPAMEQIVIMFKGCRTHREWADALSLNSEEKIGAILQRTWENAPDHPDIHKIPSWGVLCYLCSEYCCGIEDDDTLSFDA